METNPRERVWLSRAAVENWGRLQDPPPTSLSDARMALLESIEADGVITIDDPPWMTSAPVVDAWLLLPDDIALVLVADTDAASGRDFIVKNTRAPRRRTKQAGAKPTNVPMREPTELNDPAVRADLVTISVHANERLELRGGLTWDQDEWNRRIESATLAPVPGWADAAGGGGWAFTWSDGDNEWVAIIRQLGSTERWVIPTVLSRAWIESDLDLVRNNRDTIEVSSTVSDWWGDGWESDGLTAPIELEADGIAGPWLATSRGLIRLYPADSVQRARGIRWVAQQPPQNS